MKNYERGFDNYSYEDLSSPSQELRCILTLTEKNMFNFLRFFNWYLQNLEPATPFMVC